MARWGSAEHESVVMAATIAAAEAIAAEGRLLTKGELGARLGIGDDWARARLARARRTGLTTLTMVTEKQLRKLMRLPAMHGERSTHRGDDRSDVQVMSDLREVAYRGMGDGRAEGDDPRRIGGCLGNRGHASAPPTNAEACRRMLREYRVVRGRAKPDPKPREIGKACIFHQPRKPTKRRDSIMYGKQVARHLHAN